MSLRKAFTHGFVILLALLVGSEALAERTTTYFHTDGLGSVVAATNEAGQVIWRKDYAPFGEQIHATPDTERTSYTGKQHDKEIGLTYFGGRYFDPEIGRFVSVDPVGFVEDNTMSFNRYLYVNNNPYKYVDPDGRFLNFVAKFVADVAITVAINYATSGSLGIGAALKDSAMGVLNPAKTIVKAKKLYGLLKKADKVTPDPGIAAKVSKTTATSPTIGKPVDAKTRERILERDRKPDGSWECATCGQRTKNPDNVHTGHVNPRSKGGDLSEGNLRCEGAACNLSQGNRNAPRPGSTCAERGSCGAPYGRKD